jgi:hypothetical protein
LAAKGEVLNPFVRVAETRARQAQLILQGEVWADVAANPQMARPGELLTPEEIASGDWIPGDETQSMRYGKAKGMWINREVHDALVDIPLMQKNADSFLRGVIGTIKWNRTVGNPGRWERMHWRAFKESCSATWAIPSLGRIILEQDSPRTEKTTWHT